MDMFEIWVSSMQNSEMGLYSLVKLICGILSPIMWATSVYVWRLFILALREQRESKEVNWFCTDEKFVQKTGGAVMWSAAAISELQSMKIENIFKAQVKWEIRQLRLAGEKAAAQGREFIRDLLLVREQEEHFLNAIMAWKKWNDDHGLVGGRLFKSPHARILLV